MGDLPLKAVRTHRAQLEETLKSVPTGELERAARILAGAQFIDIYGVENSCAPASDLLTKLTYLGLPCRFHTDAYLQQIGAAHLRPGAAAIAFSHSGKSMDTVKALRLAQKAGAVTIAVAGGRTPSSSATPTWPWAWGERPRRCTARPSSPGWPTWRWWICCTWR